MPGIKWNIDLVKEFVEINGDGDTLITDVYKNSNTKLEYKCHVCNQIYSIDWNSFIKGGRHHMCPNKDRGKFLRTPYKDIKRYYEAKGYTLISETYKNAKEKLETICPNGHTYFSCFSDFKQGYGCGICSHMKVNLNHTLTLDYVRNYVLEHGDGDILISEKYLKSKEKIKIFCHICEKEYSITFDRFQRGSRCLKCSYIKKIKTRTDNRVNNGHNLGKENPELLLEWDWDKNTIDPYRIGSYSRAIAFWLCPKCGKSYETTIGNRAGTAKSGCPFCNESKGEKTIKKYLENFKIDYIPQYRFKDCKYKKVLSFDFYLTEYKICLEFSGKQHFCPIDYFGGEKMFKIQQIRDKTKKDYCEKNNIPLIIIPYWEYDNIEIILNELLSSKKKGGKLNWQKQNQPIQQMAMSIF